MIYPTVFAVIPTRNRKSKSLRFLQEICNQTYSQLRVVVVDSNSSDGTRDAVKSTYPEVFLLDASDNDYWANATNIGVRFALAQGCDFIFTVNDDSAIQADHIERLVEIVRRHNLLILGSRIDYMANPGLVWSLGTSSEWGSTNFIGLNYHQCKFSDLPESTRVQDCFKVSALAGNGVLLHRSVYENIGFYNAFFAPHYHADTELTLRASANGIKCWVAPNVVLLNDFVDDQKTLDLSSFSGLYCALFRKKSHLFVWPWLYLFFRYCPMNLKLTTFVSAISKLLALRSKSENMFKT